MRIAIEARTVLESRSGIGKYALELLRTMSAVAPSNQYMSTITRDGLGALKAAAPSVEAKVSRIRPGTRGLPYLWEEVSLPLRLAAWRPDVFHNPTGILPFAPIRAATVVTVHDMTPYKSPELHKRIFRDLFRLRFARTMAVADRVVADSASTLSDLCDVFPHVRERTTVIPLWAGSRFHPGRDERALARLRGRGLLRHFILSVGTIEPRKNHLRLIRAFEQIAHRHEDFDLVLAGASGWLNTDVYAAARGSWASHRIHFLDYVAESDLPELYRMATIMAYPSLYEGFGLPPLESMACGTPVLTSNVSSLPEVVGSAAVLVDPTDSESIAHGLARLLGDSSLRAGLSIRGIERAAQFSGETAVAATLAVYVDAVMQRRGRDRRVG